MVGLLLASSLWLAAAESGSRDAAQAVALQTTGAISCQAIERGRCFDSSGREVTPLVAPPPPAQVVSVPVDKFSDALATDLAMIGLGTGADLLSTDYFLNQSNGRCIEANPIGQRVEGRIALKIGAAALRGSAAYFLRRRGHRKVANVVRWLGVAVDGGVTANNFACVWR